MKNKTLGIICILLISVSACKKDSDPENNEPQSVVGVWAIKNGVEFSYLTLLSNNTFMYAENDADIESEAENGLELGTYSYNSDKEQITFNIVYDDNDPGNESGIGDAGTPAIFEASVLESGAKLSLLNGELIFNKKEFTDSSPITGVWGVENGTEFSYLTLLSDNTFLYGENDLDTTSDLENGIEVGTYVYNSTNGTITFTIVYDDNDSGNDSGIGDIGTDSTIDVVLSNGNNTLTISGLVLTKAL
ncbi:hypothetical protein [Wenyingzhuangia fucanilytica]|nr:hypothetical protein [Wenyingzhuangia fucanilytica]